MNNPFKGWHPAEVVIAITLFGVVCALITACGGGGCNPCGPEEKVPAANCKENPNGCK